jgi:hypothetical protein
MKQFKWMYQESNAWSSYTIRSFIIFQNTYSYDGEKPIVHSLENLIRFADISDKKVEQFTKQYKKLYPNKTLS